MAWSLCALAATLTCNKMNCANNLHVLPLPPSHSFLRSGGKPVCQSFLSRRHVGVVLVLSRRRTCSTCQSPSEASAHHSRDTANSFGRDNAGNCRFGCLGDGGAPLTRVRMKKVIHRYLMEVFQTFNTSKKFAVQLSAPQKTNLLITNRPVPTKSPR